MGESMGIRWSRSGMLSTMTLDGWTDVFKLADVGDAEEPACVSRSSSRRGHVCKASINLDREELLPTELPWYPRGTDELPRRDDEDVSEEENDEWVETSLKPRLAASIGEFLDREHYAKHWGPRWAEYSKSSYARGRA